MSELEDLLRRVDAGEGTASAELLEIVYFELHRMARSRMRSEKPNHTLSPTALVNEAYLRLFRGKAAFDNRAHFFGAAAEAMRRVLIDHARKRQSEKRGAGQQRVTFTDLSVAVENPAVDLLALDESLTALEAVDERLSLIVKLRYFVDLSVEETADVMGLSPATVKRDWAYARAWLFEHMSD